jgi:hypothetical protein
LFGWSWILARVINLNLNITTNSIRVPKVVPFNASTDWLPSDKWTISSAILGDEEVQTTYCRGEVISIEPLPHLNAIMTVTKEVCTHNLTNVFMKYYINKLVFQTQLNENSDLSTIRLMEVDFIGRNFGHEHRFCTFCLERSDIIFSYLEKGEISTFMKMEIHEVSLDRLYDQCTCYE